MYRNVCWFLLCFLSLASLGRAVDTEKPAVLFVVTGHTQLGSTDKQTGYFLSEVTHPHHVLHEAGYRVDFVSPLGGAVHMDPKSHDLEDPINKAFLDNRAWKHELANTKSPTEIDATAYGAIFFAGGHGAMWDFPDSQLLADLTARIYEQGGVVAAVCHGPAGLVNVTLGNGTALLAGKKVTGFTNEEEAAVELTEQMPFLLEDRLKSCGALFVGAENFQAHVVVSGRLVTGQNPASASGVGEAMVKLLQNPPPALVTLATSDRQWTGMTISRSGRIFVNYPRWSDEVPVSVGELQADGSVTPYPNEELNNWQGEEDAGERFVCVQSVVVDAANRLWILDPANPRFGGIVPGGPKLMEVDLSTNEIVRTIHVVEPDISPNSYLNDVRIDSKRQFAYITDSGRGGLVVVDLNKGSVWRCLDKHPSTMAEDITLTIDGKPWQRGDGSTPQIHSDGIALDANGDYLYFQPLTGRWLHRIATEHLRQPGLNDAVRGKQVEIQVKSGANDGIIFGSDGYIYLSSLEYSAIRRWQPGSDEVEWVRQHPDISWPDTFAVGPDGAIYVTTSQIHKGADVDQPYKILKLRKQ